MIASDPRALREKHLICCCRPHHRLGFIFQRPQLHRQVTTAAKEQTRSLSSLSDEALAWVAKFTSRHFRIACLSLSTEHSVCPTSVDTNASASAIDCFMSSAETFARASASPCTSNSNGGGNTRMGTGWPCGTYVRADGSSSPRTAFNTRSAHQPTPQQNTLSPGTTRALA